MEAFTTVDLSLATFLFFQGLDYTLDRTDPKRIVFIFRDKEKAEKWAKEWFYRRSQIRGEVGGGR